MSFLYTKIKVKVILDQDKIEGDFIKLCNNFRKCLNRANAYLTRCLMRYSELLTSKDLFRLFILKKIY